LSHPQIEAKDTVVGGVYCTLRGRRVERLEDDPKEPKRVLLKSHSTGNIVPVMLDYLLTEGGGS